MLDRTVHPAADTGRGFVGRAREMTALRAALQAAAGGHGRLVMLVGEAGIGKTRTAAELARQATESGALVVRGACYEGEWAPPYGALAEVLTAYVRGADAVALRADLGFGAAPLARVVAAVRERLPDVPEPTSLQPDEERFRLFDAVSQLLIAAAIRRPVVVVLDDLHWADKGTIAMLRHVARFSPQHRLLLLGTYRDVELEPQHPLTDALGALYRETTCERIALKGLDATEVAQLIAGSEVPADLQDRLSSAISAVTNGNPFFVREVLRHLLEEGQLAPTPDACTAPAAIEKLGIPDSVRQVISRRVRRTSAETGRLLSVAAAFSGPFHLDAVAQVTGLEDAAALNAIDAALRTQLVRPAEGTERYDFAHALIRETLYTELSPSRQARLHRQIAEAMEQLYGTCAAERAAEIAHQYYRSRDLPAADRGVAHALAAADCAEAAYARDEAATFLRMALALLPRGDPRRPRLHGRLGSALAWAFSFDEALQVAHQAAQLISTAEGENAAAEYLAELLTPMWEGGFFRGAFALAQRGLEYIGQRRDATYASLMAMEIIRREAEAADGPGVRLDTAERREVSRIFQLEAESHGDLDAAVPLHARPFLFSPSREDRGARGWPWDLGEYRRGLAIDRKHALECEARGRIAAAVYHWSNVFRFHIALGNFVLAGEARQRSTALAARLPTLSVSAGHFAAGEDEWRMALDEGWDAPMTAAMPDAESMALLGWFRPAMLSAMARTQARKGSEDALGYLVPMLSALDDPPAWALGAGFVKIASDAAETLWLTGRIDHVEIIERNVRQKVIARDVHHPMADGRLALARLCALRGRTDEAVEWFANARAVLDEQGARPLRAIVDYDEALMYVRRGAAGDAGRAAPLLDTALRQFRALGMTGWIRRAEQLRSSCGSTQQVSTHGRAEPADSSSAPPVPRTGTFVGRAREMELLQAGFDEMLGGRGRLVLLAGEPGIGKTRTAAELGGRARERGAAVLWGACHEGEWAPPFGPFAEAIAAYARHAEPDTLRADLGFGAAPIARVIPALRERLPDVAEPVALQPDEERFRLFDAVSQFLIATAAHTPVVMVLDDLHWADKGTIAMLRHVARFAPQHRLLLLGTYRDVELDPQHPFADALGALYRETTCERVVLNGLDEQEVAQLIADSEAPAEMRDALAAAISTATNGNPFVVREVVRHVIEESRVARAPGAQIIPAAMQAIGIPDSVRQVLARRVRRLSAETGALLTVGAAFGGPFHLHVAAHVASLDDAMALNAIDQALRAQLVRPADSAERYDFTHALIRETLYSELSPSRQARLHRQIAEAMEQVYGERVAEHAAEIAQQYYRSKGLPGAERGVLHALAAVGRAETTYARDEEVTFLRLTLDLLPGNDPQRPRVCGRLGLALAWTLSFDEALKVASAAAQLIAATEGEDAAADYLAQVIIPMSTGGFSHGAFSLAQEGLRYVGTRRDLTWASLRAMDIIREETEAPDGPGIPLDTPARRAVSRVFAEVGYDREQTPPHASVFFTFSSQDEVPRAWFWALGKYRHGASMVSKWAVENEAQGRVGEAVGNWAAAFRYHTALGEFVLAREARRRGAGLVGRFLVPSPLTAQLVGGEDEWRMALDQGWDEPVGHLGPGIAFNWYLGAVYAGVARSHARMGRTDRALRRLASAIPALEKGACWAENYVQIACDAAETLWLTGCTDHSEAIERNLRAKVIGPDLHHPMRDGRLALARLCALQGRYAEAVEWFAKARTVLDGQGARPLRAIVDYDEALMYARRSDDRERARAVPLLEAALAQFRNLGMPGWIRRAEHLLLARGEAHDQQRAHTPLAEALVTAHELDMPLLIERVETVQSGQQPTVEPRREPQPAASALRIPPSAIAAVFRRDGDYWTVAYADTVLRLKDSRGLQYVARLLRHPAQEILAIDLAQNAENGDRRSGMSERTSEPVRVSGSPTPALDAQAKAAYKRRLEALREELSEAEANNDIGRSARAREEMDMLAEQLHGAFGLGGRDRPVANDLERARSAVGKRIRAEIKRIRSAHPTLGRHLAATITTGYFCAYEPALDVAVQWVL